MVTVGRKFEEQWRNEKDLPNFKLIWVLNFSRGENDFDFADVGP